jgi:membrane fusion protein, macrolide-specific efflux system
MIRNKKFLTVIFIIILLCAVFFYMRYYPKASKADNVKEIRPAKGDIVLTVVTTGLIQPQNRLEIKPSIGGRIEEILVVEGDFVKAGQILARMSSTERAALVDAARLESEAILDYWENVYMKSPIIAPIDGDVIARYVEPGQTVTTSDTILVLSDRLVVKAQFDETDIGRVSIGQDAVIVLDAYPDIRLEGVVDHIAYESELINNVTIYNVDIITKDMPSILRSGMSVTVELIEKIRKDALTIPLSAVHYDDKKAYALIKGKDNKIVKKDLILGISNDNTAEVISGLSMDDIVISKAEPEITVRKQSGTNPFMPSRKK